MDALFHPPASFLDGLKHRLRKRLLERVEPADPKDQRLVVGDPKSPAEFGSGQTVISGGGESAIVHPQRHDREHRRARGFDGSGEPRAKVVIPGFEHLLQVVPNDRRCADQRVPWLDRRDRALADVLAEGGRRNRMNETDEAVGAFAFRLSALPGQVRQIRFPAKEDAASLNCADIEETRARDFRRRILCSDQALTQSLGLEWNRKKKTQLVQAGMQQERPVEFKIGNVLAEWIAGKTRIARRENRAAADGAGGSGARLCRVRHEIVHIPETGIRIRLL
ncbi:MAG TPA: hypothetical protein VMI72_17640 [Roseiarcus sp.]|nr:hypothetical protein [Roseiarcus sp.]